jgi:hypothetical protein
MFPLLPPQFGCGAAFVVTAFNILLVLVRPRCRTARRSTDQPMATAPCSSQRFPAARCQARLQRELHIDTAENK